MWRKKGHLKVAEKNRKWRKKILELAGDQSQNMVTMAASISQTARQGTCSCVLNDCTTSDTCTLHTQLADGYT